MKQAAVCLCLVFLAGCSHKSAGIVGKWHGTTESSPRGSVDTNAEFKADDTVAFTVRYSGATLSAFGRYATSGDTLRYTPQGGTLNGRPIPAAPNHPFPTETYHVTMTGDDLTLDQNGGTRIVLKRVR